MEFSVESSDIKAQLREDGQVEVKESHTYEFEGDFNGISRTLIPKENTTITNFQASENGEKLKGHGDRYLVPLSAGLNFLLLFRLCHNKENEKNYDSIKGDLYANV
ncbi:DUF2207 domain-containing protein [Guptibacillus hwajinpoensis]|uniref:DUF2207 domain-containing protein n=1 Tax=Guptibacillus hwajinpoensis TaxID=208199 RepID=UPI003D05B41F